jgi:hypothetical protein
MQPDPGLQPTREVRERISRSLGNDPRRLVEYYMEYQRKFSHRLRPPAHHATAAEHADSADRLAAGR